MFFTLTKETIHVILNKNNIMDAFKGKYLFYVTWGYVFFPSDFVKECVTKQGPSV